MACLMGARLGLELWEAILLLMARELEVTVELRLELLVVEFWGFAWELGWLSMRELLKALAWQRVLECLWILGVTLG
jgi:hypothetical protein